MDKKLQAKVDRIVSQIMDMSGQLSELQDTVSDLLDQAYDEGVNEGYDQRCKEEDVPENETN